MLESSFVSMVIHSVCLLLAVICPGCIRQVVGEGKPGHMLPLGSHRPPESPGIDILSSAPSPQQFFQKYVQGSRPFLIKGHAKEMPAFKLWNDKYLKSKYGHLTVDVEQGKKENRSKSLWMMTMEEFLNKYNDSDIYMVNSLPKEMMGDVLIIKSLLCGGFLDNLIDAVTWFSSGGTKSVFHFDALDNINCLIDGTKELVLVSRKYAEDLDFNVKGSYSGVDVDHVDMMKFPQFADLPWYSVSMAPGDCLYIPYRWAHQVRSAGRNLAINLWFVHQHTFDDEDCEQQGELPEFAPLSDFGVSDAYDAQMRGELLDFISMKGGALTEEDIPAAMDYFAVSQEEVHLLFDFMDANRDRQVTKEEIQDINREVFKEILSVLDEREQLEDDEEEEDKEEEEEESYNVNDIPSKGQSSHLETNKSEL